MSGRYYIQHTELYAYDFVLWWRPNRQGYTYNIDEAGLYDESEAQNICGLRGEEAAWREEDVLKHMSRAVNVTHLYKNDLTPHFKEKRS